MSFIFNNKLQFSYTIIHQPKNIDIVTLELEILLTVKLPMLWTLQLSTAVVSDGITTLVGMLGSKYGILGRLLSVFMAL